MIFSVFIAAKGPECFQAKTQAILNCGNATYGKYAKDLPASPEQGLASLSSSLSNIKELPSLIFDQKTCSYVKLNFFFSFIINLVNQTDAFKKNQ